MPAIDQVIEWIKEIPEWQADAVRRILTQDALTDNDKAELLAMLKAKHGLSNPQQQAPQPNTSIQGQFSGSPKSKVGVVLKALEGIKNVNAIPENSYIPFGDTGLTIVYGQNGTGKSGYARILKRACSARDSTEPIQPNVFGGAASGPATALFKISVQGVGDKEIPWSDGGAKEDLLANIIVFDAKEARVIVDEESNIGFLPYGAHVFGHLADLLKEFKTTLTGEKPNVGKLEFRDVPPNTESGRFLSSLSAITTEQNIDSATRWAQEDSEKLESLKARIFEAESPDRAAKIRKFNGVLSSIETLQMDINKIDSTLSSAKEQLLKQAIDELVAAEQALSVVEQQSSGTEPLPGVGSKAWQALYMAAKEYSEKEAYPGKAFPVTEQNSRCVLCMQMMLGDTAERFHRFHEFMAQTAKKKQEEAELKLKAVLKEIESINFAQVSGNTNAILEIQERDKKEAIKPKEYLEAMKQRAIQMVEAGKQKSYSTFLNSLANPNTEITQIQEEIKKEKAALETITPSQLQTLKAEKVELDARQALVAYKGKILEHIKVLGEAKNYDQAIEETDLRGVSARGKKIISEALTPELQKALKDELKRLEASYLPIETNPARAEGEVVYRLSLTKAKLPKKVTLTDILSEGEQRVVAIAGFFAELQASGEKNPIVLDDPVSSLDHRFRDKIAQRIADEGQHRQVIVFTHEISFLLALEEYAEKNGNTKVFVQTIRRKGHIPGHSTQGTPWHAMSVGQRLDYLSKKLPDFSGLYQKDMDKYNESASTFYGQLRETWEAFVEEELLYKVVRRHRPDVQTKRLSQVEVTTADHNAVFDNMDKCSTWMTGHDKSKLLDVDRPAPDEIKADMNMLHEMMASVKKRRGKTQEGRKTD